MPEGKTLRIRRLKKRAQFLEAARGTRIAKRGFVLQSVSVPAEDFGVGYTVTKKTGNSPERNRIKRRLREVAKACSRKFKIGHNYVLIGRRECLDEPFDALVDSLSFALKRTHSPNHKTQRTEKNHER